MKEYLKEVELVNTYRERRGKEKVYIAIFKSSKELF